MVQKHLPNQNLDKNILNKIKNYQLKKQKKVYLKNMVLKIINNQKNIKIKKMKYQKKEKKRI